MVTGSVRKPTSSNARITMSLMDALSGCYLWSGEIDRKLDGIFPVQEEVALLIRSS